MTQTIPDPQQQDCHQQDGHSPGSSCSPASPPEQPPPPDRLRACPAAQAPAEAAPGGGDRFCREPAL